MFIKGWQVALLITGFLTAIVVDIIGDTTGANMEGLSILIALASIGGAVWLGFNWKKFFVAESTDTEGDAPTESA